MNTVAKPSSVSRSAAASTSATANVRWCSAAPRAASSSPIVLAPETGSANSIAGPDGRRNRAQRISNGAAAPRRRPSIPSSALASIRGGSRPARPRSSLARARRRRRRARSSAAYVCRGRVAAGGALRRPRCSRRAQGLRATGAARRACGSSARRRPARPQCLVAPIEQPRHGRRAFVAQRLRGAPPAGRTATTDATVRSDEPARRRRLGGGRVAWRLGAQVLLVRSSSTHRSGACFTGAATAISAPRSRS